MAEVETWGSICQHGLLSTTALLDLFEIKGPQREQIESQRRPEIVKISHPKYGTAIIRDNKPITDSKLKLCLSDMSIKEWYETLNRKVFFWVDENRLRKLLGAKAYRDRKHWIITANSKSLLERNNSRIFLSRINTGAIFCPNSPRGVDTFRALGRWPSAERPRARSLKCPVVELSVDYSVPDIEKVAISVEEMHGDRTIRTIWNCEM